MDCFCTPLGGVIWWRGEPTIGFIVTTVILGIAIHVIDQDKREESIYEEDKKKWEGVVRKLLCERASVDVYAVTASDYNVLYRECMNPEKFLEKETQIMPETGFEALFSCYFFPSLFPLG